MLSLNFCVRMDGEYFDSEVDIKRDSNKVKINIKDTFRPSETSEMIIGDLVRYTGMSDFLARQKVEVPNGRWVEVECIVDEDDVTTVYLDGEAVVQGQ